MIAAGESLAVEFKRATHGSINDNALVEAVTCMANGEGGLLLLGVEDDGTGVAPRHGSTTDPHGAAVELVDSGLITQPA